MMLAKPTSVLFALLSFSLLTGCTQSFVGPGELTVQGEEAFEILRTAPVFAGAAVGFAGTTPETVEAFRILLQEPEASAAFKLLQSRSRKAGQLYALAGLYYTDRGYLERVVGSYLHDQSPVQTYFGCIIGHRRVSVLAAQIMDGSLPASFRGRAQ